MQCLIADDDVVDDDDDDDDGACLPACQLGSVCTSKEGAWQQHSYIIQTNQARHGSNGANKYVQCNAMQCTLERSLILVGHAMHY
jgi:hypothetical protein